MTTVWSPPLSVQPGSNASFQCQFYVGEADESVFDYVTVGLWERGGISVTLLTLTKRGNVIVNPKLNKEAPLYAGRVHGRQWKNTTTNTSGITVKIKHVEESDEGFYGCSIFFGAFKGVLGESVKIDVQGRWCCTKIVHLPNIVMFSFSINRRQNGPKSLLIVYLFLF